MFGWFVSGQPAQSSGLQASAEPVYLPIRTPLSTFNLATFLTAPLAIGTQVSFFFSGSENEWIPLGSIWNEKPSAIFKISPTTAATEHRVAATLQPLDPSARAQDSVVARSNAPNAEEIVRRIGKSFVNYALSFISDISDANATIPISVVQEWFLKLVSSLRKNPRYIDSLASDD